MSKFAKGMECLYICYFHTAKKNKNKLMDAYDQNKRDCKRLKKCSIEDLGKALLKWIKVQRSTDFPVSELIK